MHSGAQALMATAHSHLLVHLPFNRATAAWAPTLLLGYGCCLHGQHLAGASVPVVGSGSLVPACQVAHGH
jgi:hypothetical protein